MNPTERQPVDDAWREALAGAESSPSPRVWAAVEGALHAAENQRNKRRVVFYQRAAAAILLLSLGSGIVVYERWPSEQTALIQSAPYPYGNGLGSEGSAMTESTGHASETTPSIASSAGDRQRSHTEHDVTPQARKTTLSSGASKTERHNYAKKNQNDDARSVEFLLARQKPELSSNDPSMTDLPMTAAPADRALVASAGDVPASADSATVEAKNLTPEEERELVRKLLGDEQPLEPKRQNESRGMWAALGASGGSYSPGALPDHTALMSGTVTPGSALAANPTSERATRGKAYSVGFSLGRPVGDRWMVQAGAMYMNQQIDYTSNITAISPFNTATAFTADALQRGNVASLQLTTPYVINSVSEFVSIPVQVGYRAVDRKIGVMISTGVATDFFVRNTLIDQSGRAETVRQSAGSESAYRPVTWAGLGNVEVSYRLARNYSLAVVPGIRYSLGDVSRADDSVYQPLVLDVGFRFRYQFD